MNDDYKRGYADAMNWKAQNHLEHLPQRTWVGLTDDERIDLMYESGGNEIVAIQITEAKLKEKNT